MPEDNKNIPSILITWLTEITTWNRAGIAIILGLTSLFGVLVYQNPQTVFEMINGFIHQRDESLQPFLTPLTTEVRRDITQVAPSFAPHLIGLTVWRVSLASNQVQLVAWWINPTYQGTFDQVYQERWKYAIALFGDNPELNNAFGRLYIGRFHCTKEIQSFVSARRFPIKDLCMVAIPPDGYGLGGIIAGAWDDDLPWDQLAGIEATFRDLSHRMTWYPRKRKE